MKQIIKISSRVACWTSGLRRKLRFLLGFLSLTPTLLQCTRWAEVTKVNLWSLQLQGSWWGHESVPLNFPKIIVQSFLILFFIVHIAMYRKHYLSLLAAQEAFKVICLIVSYDSSDSVYVGLNILKFFRLFNSIYFVPCKIRFI